MHVRNGIACGVDCHILVIVADAEAGVLIVGAINGRACSVVVHSDGVHCGVGGAVQSLGLDVVVTGTINVLLPDNHRVVRGGIHRPLCVDVRAAVAGEGSTKREGVARRISTLSIGRSGIPASKRIARTLGILREGLSHLVVLDELRGVVRSVLAVLVEHQPVACRRADAEGYVTTDGYLGTVWIQLAIGVSLDVAATFVDQPALEVLEIAAGRVAHVYRVLSGRHAGNRKNRDGAQRSLDLLAALVDLADVRHRVRVVDERVDVDGGAAIGDVERLEVRAHIRNGQYLIPGFSAIGIKCFDSVVGIERPALEHLVGSKLARTGIVNDLLDLLGGVAVLDIHGLDKSATVIEVHGCARHFAGLGHNVDREPIGLEALRPRIGNGGLDGHGNASLVLDVVHVNLGTGNTRVHELHLDGREGLSLNAVGIEDGHVDGDHVADFLILLGSGSLDGVGNGGAIDDLSDNAAVLGKRTLGCNHVDDSVGTVDAIGKTLRGIGHRRFGLFLRLSLNFRLLLGNSLVLNRGFLFGLGLDCGLLLGDSLLLLGSRLLYCRILLENNLVFNDGLLDGILRLGRGLVVDDIHLRLGSRILDDDSIHVVGRERLRRRLEGICHSLRGEHLPHEDEREDPSKRTARALAEPAELLTHDQHLSFGPRDDGKIDTAVPWSHIAPFNMIEVFEGLLAADSTNFRRILSAVFRN